MKLENLFEGSELSPELTTQLQSIFESELEARVSTKLEQATSELKESLTAEYDAKFEQATSELKESLTAEYDAVLVKAKEEIASKFDNYVSYVAENWLESNLLAVETGVKVQLAESLFQGILGVMTENHIQVDSDAMARLTKAEEKNAELNRLHLEAVNALAAARTEVLMLEQSAIVADVSTGLADTQVEKLYEMVKPYTVLKDLESFRSKVELVAETLKGSTSQQNSLNESAPVNGSSVDDNITKYAQFLAKSK
jgi:hypothetical protein